MLAIGGCTVGELKERMSVGEARQWRLFGLVYGPFGEKRADYRSAQISEAVLSAAGAKKDDESYFTTEECLLVFKTQHLTLHTEGDKNQQLLNNLLSYFGRFR